MHDMRRLMRLLESPQAKQPKKKKPYWIFVSKDEGAEKWGVQFGDYDRKSVDAEAADYKANDRREKVKAAYKVIRCEDDKQATIDEAVKELNTQSD